MVWQFELTGLNCVMTDINQEHVDCRLRRPDHVLSRGYKFNARMIQFMTSPTISGLVANLIPVKQLGNLIGHAAHAASPSVFSVSSISRFKLRYAPIASVDELDVWIDVRPAPTTASDDGICDEWNLLFSFIQRSVGGDDESQRNFRFALQGRRRRNCVDCTPEITRIGICSGRGRYA